MCTRSFEGQKLVVVVVVEIEMKNSDKKNLRVTDIVFKILKTKGPSEAQGSQELKMD